MSLDSQLARLALRATADPTFLGYWLARYAARHGLSDGELAARLGCTLDALTRLRLCGAVRAGHVVADVRGIVAVFPAVDAAVLAEMAMG